MLNYEFPPLGGGAGNATYYLLREFSKRKDIEVALVTSSVGAHAKEMFAPHITIYRLDVNKSGNIHYQSLKDLLVYSWKAYWFCRKLIKNEQFDLIHAFFGIPCGFIAMKLSYHALKSSVNQEEGLPYIVSLRGSDVPFYSKRFFWLDTFFFKRLSRKIWKNSNSVIANSKLLKELAQHTSSQQDIDVIHNGIDTQEFKVGTQTHGVFTILSTSRLIKRKGITHLIQAFIDFNKKNKKSRLVLVGDGDLKERLEEEVRRAGIERRVRFVGAISHDKMSEYYTQADVFVLSSLNEGMSNSLLEAMSSGLAIVTTNVGGTKELIENNGFIVRKGKNRDIVESLQRLYRDKTLLDTMKKNSRKKAEQMSWKRAARDYMRIYKSQCIQ